MPITRGLFRTFDFDRSVVLFSMMNSETEVPCAVSTSAMDDMEKSSGTKPDQREQQFLRLRDRIEACAIRKFDKAEFEGRPPGIILRSIDFR